MARIIDSAVTAVNRNLPKIATAWPALARLAATMTARPSFQEVHAREGRTDWT